MKGGKAVILKDENDRFITGNVGNNNTANGPDGAMVSIPASTQKSRFATTRNKSLAIESNSYLL